MHIGQDTIESYVEFTIQHSKVLNQTSFYSIKSSHFWSKVLIQGLPKCLHTPDFETDVLKSNITTVIRAPIFEWYVVRCGSKNWHQKDTYLQGIGLCAQNMLNSLGWIVNMIERTNMTT